MGKLILSFIIRRILTISTQLENCIKGKDGQYSIRRIFAVLGLYKFLSLSCVAGDVNDAYIWALVSLIAALLSLTTFQNVRENDNLSQGPQ